MVAAAAGGACTPTNWCYDRKFHSKDCSGNRCFLVERACFFNASLFHFNDGLGWKLLSANLRVPWNSFHILNHEELNAPKTNMTAVRPLLDRSQSQDSSCNPPIMWVPVWSINFADTFLSSVIPLLELEQKGALRANSTPLIVDTLRKHMNAHCRSNTNGPCQTPGFFRKLVGSISRLHFVSDPDIAPTCSGPGVEGCSRPTCYSHVRFCSLRAEGFDVRPKNLRVDVWGAGQRVAQSVLGTQVESVKDDQSASAPVSSNITHVIIERRISKGRMKGRNLANVDELLERCSRLRWLWCEEYTFGINGLAEDIRRVRSADVLVGLHGAGLTNSFFARRRFTLIEVRPYGFDGAWPDTYFKNAINQVTRPRMFYLQIALGSPDLCHPNRGYALHRQHASMTRWCKLPWEALRRALDVIGWWRYGDRPWLLTHSSGSWSTQEDRYLSGSWASRNLVAYSPVVENNRSR